MKKVVILGTGGFGREVFSFLKLSRDYKVVGFLDADLSLKGTLINDVPVLGDDNELGALRKSGVSCAFAAVGNSKLREGIFEKIRNFDFELINIIHPSAVIVPDVSIGQGVVIYPNVTINTGVKIGNSVLINSNVSIGHDVEISDFVNINPGVNIAGRVKIGKFAFLGIGSSIIENTVIGCNSIIGGGALVKGEVVAGTTVVGVPAREITEKQKNKSSP